MDVDTNRLYWMCNLQQLVLRTERLAFIQQEFWDTIPSYDWSLS